MSALKKTESAVDLLKGYLCEGEPKPAYKKSPTVGGSPDGGELAGVGKQSGDGSGAATAGTDAKTGQAKVDAKVLEERLSEDDAEGAKPIEKIRKSEAAMLLARTLTPQAQRDMVAHENAQVVARLRKGPEYIEHGPGVQKTDQALQKSDQGETDQARVWQKGLGTYTDAADLATERFMKSGSVYHGEHFGCQGAPNAALVSTQLCKSCDAPAPKFLTACPSCGDGMGQSAKAPAAVSATDMFKAQGRPGLRRPKEQILIHR